jgi:hypothetical protein
MWEMLLILILGFMPPLLSLWVTYKTRERLLERVRIAQDVNPPWRGNSQAAIPTPSASSPLHYRSGIGYVIGDSSCAFNARSPHLRCAVNPTGPCTDCRFYEPIDGERNNQDE